MELKTQGLVIKLIDYKDADKLASIFTFDYGIITAKFRGVKKEKAKLKAVAQPFTFADFNIAGSGNNITITNASLLDNFYNILNNYNKTICGYIVLDMIKSIIPENKPEKDLFLLTVSTLKNIEINNEYITTIQYIIKFLDFCGVGINFIENDYVYFDKISGDFVATKSENCIQIDKTIYKNLKEINYNQLENIKENNLKQILRLLHNIIFIRLDEDIKSFQFI